MTPSLPTLKLWEAALQPSAEYPVAIRTPSGIQHLEREVAEELQASLAQALRPWPDVDVAVLAVWICPGCGHDHRAPLTVRGRIAEVPNELQCNGPCGYFSPVVRAGGEGDERHPMSDS